MIFFPCADKLCLPYPMPVVLISQVAPVVKNLPANSGDLREMDSNPESDRPPREKNGNLLQYSCLGNSMDRGAWWATD